MKRPMSVEVTTTAKHYRFHGPAGETFYVEAEKDSDDGTWNASFHIYTTAKTPHEALAMIVQAADVFATVVPEAMKVEVAP